MMRKQLKWETLVLLMFISIPSFGQRKLTINAQAVEALLSWFNNGCNSTQIDGLTTSPTSRFMEQLLLKEEPNTLKFNEALIRFSKDKKIENNLYMLNDAYQHKDSIRVLLDHFKSMNLADDIYQNVMKYFPSKYKPAYDFQIFLSATGWKWGDAMTFNYDTQNKNYLITEKGTPAMIFNQTLIYEIYGKSYAKRMETFKQVASHELFHAMFSDYRQQYWATKKGEMSINDQFYLFLLNEGIAHYVADGNMLKEKYNLDDKLKKHEATAFASLADSTKIIFDAKLPEEKRFNTMNSGLYGDYWNKYLCITGLFMAYHMDQLLGRNALHQAVENGPKYFVKAYVSLQKKHTDLPVLPAEVIRESF